MRELVTHTESIATDGDAVQKSEDAGAALEEVSADIDSVDKNFYFNHKAMHLICTAARNDAECLA